MFFSFGWVFFKFLSCAFNTMNLTEMNSTQRIPCAVTRNSFFRDDQIWLDSYQILAHLLNVFFLHLQDAGKVFLPCNFNISLYKRGVNSLVCSFQPFTALDTSPPASSSSTPPVITRERVRDEKHWSNKLRHCVSWALALVQAQKYFFALDQHLDTQITVAASISQNAVASLLFFWTPWQN